MKEYKFDMKQVEAFRYRMEDALRAVTRSAVKEARVKELKQEILNSDKLKVRIHGFGFHFLLPLGCGTCGSSLALWSRCL